MPMKHGKSNKDFQANLKKSLKEGKPKKQSLAIAYSEADLAKKRDAKEKRDMKKKKEITMANKKNWISKATQNKGGLHRALHVPSGEKIPAKKLAKAAKSSNPKVRKQVALAKTLSKLRKK